MNSFHADSSGDALNGPVTSLGDRTNRQFRVLPLDDGEYMAFGLSGDDNRSVMVGGDVVVAWLDRATGQGFAHDYYLQAKAQCAGGKGACPDTKIRVGRLADQEACA